jgi:FKBP-type peptidyl-prolyl cis-trans isomerase
MKERNCSYGLSSIQFKIEYMAQKKIFIVVGICIIIVGLGTGLILLRMHSNSIKPVDNKVGTQKTSSTIPVSTSAGNGIQQAGSNQSGTADSATKSDTQAEIAKMTDPTTFSQYDTAKYKDATNAFYADLQVGTGATLSKSGQKPVIIYRGWLTNGTLFDETKVNSKGQNEAFSFTYQASPEQVIPGMDEGMAGMKVGGIRLLIIPPAAGYGSTARDTIPANSVLVFEVQLAEIQ